jgi:hypothetical protein
LAFATPMIRPFLPFMSSPVGMFQPLSLAMGSLLVICGRVSRTSRRSKVLAGDHPPASLVL